MENSILKAVVTSKGLLSSLVHKDTNRFKFWEGRNLFLMYYYLGSS